MNRWLPALVSASLLAIACTTTKPPAQPAVDPSTDPTVVGAVDEAARQGSIESAEGAEAGRRIGRVAGVLAAVLGGGQHDSVDGIVDRYRTTRDAAEATGALIGAAHGVKEGAKRGFVLDQQFAELHAIEGVDVFRPYPDVLEAHFDSAPSPALLASVAAVFKDREERAIDIDAAGAEAFDVRDALIELGLPATSLAAHRNGEVRGVVVRVRYRD